MIVAEPPPGYRMLRPMVVDCSVLCALLFQEPERDEAEIRIAGHALNAPGLLDYELANVASKKRSRGNPGLVGHALDLYTALPIRLHGCELRPVCELAERYALSAYDAAYLWLAATLKAPLATFDVRLGEAARRHLSDL